MDFFGRFFGEKSVFGAAGEEIRVEKSFEKNRGKIAENRRFFADFSEMAAFWPIFRRLQYTRLGGASG